MFVSLDGIGMVGHSRRPLHSCFLWDRALFFVSVLLFGSFQGSYPKQSGSCSLAHIQYRQSLVSFHLPLFCCLFKAVPKLTECHLCAGKVLLPGSFAIVPTCRKKNGLGQGFVEWICTHKIVCNILATKLSNAIAVEHIQASPAKKCTFMTVHKLKGDTVSDSELLMN